MGMADEARIRSAQKRTAMLPTHETFRRAQRGN
jgi:hypothetical protein